ncbi:MAG: S-adenosylhomocysteine deaminase [Myxococcales bacterium]|nr:S-adenosylhomocysteine deaminase [Myxococcales bacterium]|tara:strand:- start:309 stop:1688 length:1380 start_codon:yes stop_codon:yes gene_type:complete
MDGPNTVEPGEQEKVFFEPDALLLPDPDSEEGLKIVWGDGVLCHNDRIEQIGPRDTIEEAKNARTVRLRDRILVPGTINAHNHSFQSLLRGVADDRPFLVWRDEALYRYAPHLGKEGVYTGALLAFAEMARMGVTTVCDFFYVHGEGIETDLAVVQAARDVGIRLVLARTFYDWDGAPECFQESPDEAERAFRELHTMFSSAADVSVLPAPHSPHGASAEMIQRGAGIASELDLPWHLHLAEELFEVDEIREHSGTTPVGYLQQIECLNGNLCIVHGVYLPDEDIAALGEVGAGVLHCPSSNMFLGDGAAPLRTMLAKGMRGALGSDGGCSNNRVSVFEEMRMAALLQKVIATDGGAFDAPTAFRLGTEGGADLCGVDAGQIAVGRLADFVSLDLADLSLQPDVHLLRNIVYALQPTAIREVFVGAKPVVQNGGLTRIREQDVRARVVSTAKRIGLQAV